MDPRRRDALLAVVALAGLLIVGATTVGVPAFLGVRPATVGVVGAVLLEATFLRYPDRMLGIWERRGVAPGSALAVLVVGVAAVSYEAAWLLGVLAWGLVTYLVILAAAVGGLDAWRR